jgi:hypothetical protein
MKKLLDDIRGLLAEHAVENGPDDLAARHGRVRGLVDLMFKRGAELAQPEPPRHSTDWFFHPAFSDVTPAAARKALVDVAPALLEAWVFFQEMKSRFSPAEPKAVAPPEQVSVPPLKVISVRVSIVAQEPDGTVRVYDPISWTRDDGRELDLTFTHTRPMHHDGSDKPARMVADGPVHFEMKVTKHGPPERVETADHDE